MKGYSRTQTCSKPIIDGRWEEWACAGQYAVVKSQLVVKKIGLGLPSTGRAVDSLRRKKCSPEATKQLVVQGLSSDAAVALVAQVIAPC